MNAATSSNHRRSALLIAIPAAAIVFAVLHHPAAQIVAGATREQIAEGLHAVSTVNAAFHAGVMLLIGVQALGLFSFAEALGTRRLSVRAGFLFYAVGAMLLFSAASTDGFAMGFLAWRMDSGGMPDAATSLAALTSLSSAIQGFTRGGLLAQSFAMLCWSIAVASSRRSLRVVAMLGCIAAVALITVLLRDAAPIGPKQLTVLSLIAAVWALGAAACLWQKGFAERAIDQGALPAMSSMM